MLPKESSGKMGVRCTLVGSTSLLAEGKQATREVFRTNITEATPQFHKYCCCLIPLPPSHGEGSSAVYNYARITVSLTRHDIKHTVHSLYWFTRPQPSDSLIRHITTNNLPTYNPLPPSCLLDNLNTIIKSTIEIKRVASNAQIIEPRVEGDFTTLHKVSPTAAAAAAAAAVLT